MKNSIPVRRATVLWVAVGLILLLAGNYSVGLLFFDNWPDRGQFGDLFGLANALFAGLAFAGLIYAILLQRQELALQRQELTESRKQLEAQARAQQALFTATVAQIRIAAIEAKIEAQKVHADAVGPGSKRKHANPIKDLADDIDNLAETLESR